MGKFLPHHLHPLPNDDASQPAKSTPIGRRGMTGDWRVSDMTNRRNDDAAREEGGGGGGREKGGLMGCDVRLMEDALAQDQSVLSWRFSCG